MHKISIITINLNNVAGLQKTMSSVFKQTFKDIEYIIIDGDSNDGSKKLITEKEDKLSYWISEKDSGVYNAMNKGIKKASGKYLLFLNSGDYLVDENILSKVSNELDGTGIIYGNVFLIESPRSSWTGVYPSRLSFQHFVDSSLPHPSSFIKRCVFDEVGYYDERLKIVADWKFFVDAICKFNVSYKHLDLTVSVFSLDGLSSLPANKVLIEEEKNAVFKNDYNAFIKNSEELIQLRKFKNHPSVLRFAKLAKAIGLLKGIDY
ncbi:MAG: glycosyltransferase family 2 protein [Ferruginibacter sp.]